MRLYYVVYRTGGKVNAKWLRSVAMPKAEAYNTAKEVERGGRKALVVDKIHSDAIGLPTGYEYKRQS